MSVSASDGQELSSMQKVVILRNNQREGEYISLYLETTNEKVNILVHT